MTKLMKMTLILAVLATSAMATEQEFSGEEIFQNEDVLITPGHTLKVAADTTITSYVTVKKDPGSSESGDCKIVGTNASTSKWINGLQFQDLTVTSATESGIPAGTTLYQLSGRGNIDSSVTSETLAISGETLGQYVTRTSTSRSSGYFNLMSKTAGDSPLVYDDMLVLASERRDDYENVVDINIDPSVTGVADDNLYLYAGTANISGSLKIRHYGSRTMNPSFTLAEGGSLTIDNTDSSKYSPTYPGTIDASKGKLVVKSVTGAPITFTGKLII